MNWPLLVETLVAAAIILILIDIAAELTRLVRAVAALTPKRAVRAQLTFQIQGGSSAMPATIQIGKTATAVFTEFDAQGTKVPPAGAVTFASDNPAVATVDPASGIATAVAVGTCNISATDAGDSLSASDSLTVADTPVKATLVLTAN